MTIFDKLERVDVVVPHSERFYDFLATFDCESALRPVRKLSDDDDDAEKTTYLNTHIPVSISVASNVPDFTDAKFFCDEDPSTLVRDFVNHLREISDVAFAKSCEKWRSAIDLLHGKIAECENPIERKHLRSLQNEFETYCKQLLVFGFNSSKNDFVLLCKYLLKELGVMNTSKECDDDDFDDNDVDGEFVDMAVDETRFSKSKRSHVHVIKKDSGYLTILTPEFRWLDVSMFLAPGYSLKKFYDVYGVKVQNQGKSFFPYEKLTGFEYLKCMTFPSYDDFYSTLKNQNVLESECNGNEMERRKVGERNYNDLKLLWEERKMTCVRDLLEYYSNMDVLPMVSAILEMKKFYQERDFDIFKIAFSVSGIARIWLPKTAKQNGIHIPLIPEADADMHYLFKAAVCGGPSIIFHRYAEADQTFVRNNPEYPVKTIVGWDCNALYPNSFNYPFPTGFYVPRFAPDLGQDQYLNATKTCFFGWITYHESTA